MQFYTKNGITEKYGMKIELFAKKAANHLVKLASLMHCLTLPKKQSPTILMDHHEAAAELTLRDKEAGAFSYFLQKNRYEALALLNSVIATEHTIHKSFPWLLK